MTIGKLGEVTDTNIETIRYYERAGVLPRAERSAAGYRRYTSDDVRRLRFIRRGRDLGFSLDQVRELAGLADDPRRSCAEIDRIAGVHLEDVEKKIARLTALKRELRRLLVQCEQGEVSHCLIVDALTKDHHG
jgi:DNA-binding transcriptional MerR regulator